MIIFSIETLIEEIPKSVADTALKTIDQEAADVVSALLTEHDVYVVGKISYRIIDTLLINSGLSEASVLGEEQMFSYEGGIETIASFADDTVLFVSTVNENIQKVKSIEDIKISTVTLPAGEDVEDPTHKLESLSDLIEVL